MLYIKKYNENDVFLSNNIAINKSFILYDDTYLIQDITNVGDIDQKVFSIFPKKEVLVIGCGEKFIIPNDSVKNFAQICNLKLEWMTTQNAYHVFNLLIDEYRDVVGLFIK